MKNRRLALVCRGQVGGRAARTNRLARAAESKPWCGSGRHLCALTVARAAIDIPSGDAKMDSATLVGEKPFAIAERGPTPGARITPTTPRPGAPSGVDMLDVLADWVEMGRAPGPLTVVEQTLEAQPKVSRGLPLCEWPLWPKYMGTGAASAADSFTCSR